MTQLVSYSLVDGVATLQMDDGKANVISPAMVEALNAALDQAERDAALVVLKGRPGMFSGGFDLGVMMSSMQAAAALVQSGSQLARRMLAFPLPIIAVSEGHAIAMGAFLLMCSDYRIGLDGAFKYSLNEVAIGLTLHHVGIELARGRLTRRHFNRAVVNAEVFAPAAAVEAGFIDSAIAADQLEAATALQIGAMRALNRQAFAQTKRKSRQLFLEKIEWAIDQDARDFEKVLKS